MPALAREVVADAGDVWWIYVTINDLLSALARVPQLGPDLVSCEVGDSLEDGGGGWCGAGLGGDLVAGDGDGHVPEGSEVLDELLDGHAGAVLQVASDGQGGEDDGEVGLDGVPLSVEHGSGLEV